MQEAVPPKARAGKNVAPMTADHGMNPGWGVYEERPVIPAFNGVAEISRLAMMFTLWSKVEGYLYEDIGLEPLSDTKEEKKHRAVLLESETFLVALLCLLNNEHYSAGGLVDAMVGVSATADQRGNARKRILNRTLPIIGDRYGLIDYSERHMGNSMEYSICRSQRLVEFAETQLVTSISDIMGAPLEYEQGECQSTESKAELPSTARSKSKSGSKGSRRTSKKKNTTADSGESI